MAAQRELSLDVARGSLPAAATCPGSLSRCWCAGLGPAMPPQLSTVRFPCTAARRDLGWDAAGRTADAHPQAHWGLAAPGYSQDNQKTSVGGEQKKKQWLSVLICASWDHLILHKRAKIPQAGSMAACAWGTGPRAGESFMGCFESRGARRHQAWRHFPILGKQLSLPCVSMTSSCLSFSKHGGALSHPYQRTGEFSR